ncbi:hypothetical protein WME99_16205 [Sorangium sp. So ce136]|uniref:hypothetical protein n=1 Tax=Sorangium sp. So ce136 TaxID=3133284 RepID=UPI003F0A919D
MNFAIICVPQGAAPAVFTGDSNATTWGLQGTATNVWWGAAVATLDPFKQVEAETIAFSSGLKTEVCTDTGAGMNVTPSAMATTSR